MKLLFKVKFGSHLYGTNTPKSDLDYKGVYQAEMSDIILKRDKATIHEDSKKSSAGYRNSPDDIDIEYKELREFLREAMAGQTYALDMLFSPENMWITSSHEWEFIIANRQKLLSKNVQPFLGYIRQQTAKYGLKGTRLAELQRVIKYFEQFSEKDMVGEHLEGLALGEFVKIAEVDNERPNGLPPIHEKYLDVLGKRFQDKLQIKNMLIPLRKFDEEYGGRSRMAANNEGVDWKAVSHAFRCCFQLTELSLEQKITFPLRHAELIKDIKQGKIPWLTLQDELSYHMEVAFNALKNSNLPENPDREFWNDFIISTYLHNKNRIINKNN